MKVIFLDFDGVIVTVHDRFTAGDAYCVFLLNQIIKKTGAKIVVSSSWRRGSTVEELAELLKSWGVEGEVIGKTPVIDDKERGHEIQTWLDECPVDKFIILDDDSDMAHLKSKWIECHSYNGMDVPQMKEAVERLNGVP